MTTVLSERTLADIEAVLDDEFLSARALWQRLRVGAPTSMKAGLRLLADQGRCEARKVPMPNGLFQNKYRRASKGQAE